MEIVSNCCGAKVEGLNADNIGRCSECGEGCGVDIVSSHCVKHNKSICKECQKDGLWDFGVPEKEGCGVEVIYERPDFQKIALEKVKGVRKEIISKLSEQKK